MVRGERGAGQAVVWEVVRQPERHASLPAQPRWIRALLRRSSAGQMPGFLIVL